MSDLIRYWPIVRDIIAAIRSMGGDPAVELRRIKGLYQAKARAEDAWEKLLEEKFGGEK
jgi:hypothetical protein